MRSGHQNRLWTVDLSTKIILYCPVSCKIKLLQVLVHLPTCHSTLLLLLLSLFTTPHSSSQESLLERLIIVRNGNYILLVQGIVRVRVRDRGSKRAELGLGLGFGF